MYPRDIAEEELKNKVGEDFFKSYDHTEIKGNIDFCVSEKSQKGGEAKKYFLWAEAKKGTPCILNSIVQLILTIGKAKAFSCYHPPKYIGAFDCEKILFLPCDEKISEIFNENDFNWKIIAPSDHTTREFKTVLEIVKEIIKDKKLEYRFKEDKTELKDFIKNNFTGDASTSKSKIDKNNFMLIYNKWLDKVKPSIKIDWKASKKMGIIDGDFYLADLLSAENKTLAEKLYVVLDHDKYKLNRKKDNETKLLNENQADFIDEQQAHKDFWQRYERPPEKEYWDYIIKRRDLLVPQDIRERKGSFFTPRQWVERSQEYLARALGENWQEQYIIWDCAAGTGNLLVGLVEPYRIYASTIDKQDVDVIHARIKEGAHLLEDQVFQFDFLNDGYDKLPEGLRKIINDDEKRKKLLIYINPPYAEATSATTVTGTGKNKDGVSTIHKLHEELKPHLGKASNELFALFMGRIARDMPGVKLGIFSKLKFINGSNFKKFKEFFKGKYLGGFICPANTFDNVRRKFPIGFTMWDLEHKEPIGDVSCNIYDKNANPMGQKTFYGNLPNSINKWIKQYYEKSKDIEVMGLLESRAPDFQNNKYLCILTKKQARYCYNITQNNLIPMCVYFAVRYAFKATWLNDRDQFLAPNEHWLTDLDFHHDCLAFTLFHGQNRITSNEGTNHWIPFTAPEVKARTRFDSDFMVKFIDGQSPLPEHKEHSISQIPLIPTQPIAFSKEARAVFGCALDLWKHYHAQDHHNVNASFYDIKAFFQGFKDSGKMKTKSSDVQYNKILAELKFATNDLALKRIQDKVYEYGFLRN